MTVRLRCCDPRSEWCSRSTMAAAIDHARKRAIVAGRRQAVYRSRVHEQAGDTRQFWMISTHRRDLTLAAVRRKPRTTLAIRCPICHGCPVCHGTVEVHAVFVDERTGRIPGRWDCTRGCDPTTAAPTDCP